MSPRREKFCLAYAKTGNAKEAYKLAGYETKGEVPLRANASRLLATEEVQKRLREIASEVQKNEIANIEECQMILTEIARDKSQKGIVRVQALNTLLKAQGAFSTQINLNATMPVVISGVEDLED